MSDPRQRRRIVLLAYRRMLPFYGRRLFFLYEARPLRLFIYQQQLLVGRLLRSLSALGRPIVASGENPFLVETPNHTLARARALQSGYELGAPITPGQLSRRFGLVLIWWNLATWLAHPAIFMRHLGSTRLRHVHERLFFGPRTRAIIVAAEQCRLDGLTVSNDHMGQSFQLATVSAALGVPVTYVQHGAVTVDFPPNDFARLLVWDDESADIYRDKTHGVITVDSRLKTASTATESLPTRYLLCALSTDYPLWPTVLGLRQIARASRPQTLLVRFHPSDKRAWMVATMVRAFGGALALDVSTRPFIQSFMASDLAFIGTSSVLRDAVEISSEKVIWLRYLGSSKDVFGIAGLPRATASSLTELKKVLSDAITSLPGDAADNAGISPRGPR